MFGKLKEKLKGWFKKSTEKVQETAQKQEIVEPVEEPVKKEKFIEKKPKEKKKLKETKKQKIKPVPTKPIEEIKPGIPKSAQEKDSAEILSQQPKETILEILEEDKKETAKEVEEKIEEIKELEIEQEAKAVEEQIEQAKKEKIPQVPQEYDVAKHKYEPDIGSIKEQAGIIAQEEVEEPQKKSFFQKLKSSFSYKISENGFDEIFDDLELLLLENNVALEVVEALKKELSRQLIGKEIKKDNLEREISQSLKKALEEIIIEPDNPLEIIKQIAKQEKRPFVILFFGINGTGKTTSIAKLASLLKKNNISVVLAAADTFRAASIEQIQEHADKLKVPLIKHDYNADPAAVAFDAIKYAKNHSINVVLIDTAGRMHTKKNLLQEMEKICRVTNPDLKIFVAESIAGNDATEQAKSFHDMIEIDGSILSKADIDEKGGTIISVSYVTHKPIFYLGTGQRYEDLKLFDKEEFIKQLLG